MRWAYALAGAIFQPPACNMFFRAAIMSAACAIGALGWAHMRSGDIVIYNHSPSMPVGLYVRDDGAPQRGAIVTVRARDVAPAEAMRRHFDRDRDRFLKRVAAAGGDLACSNDDGVRINGTLVAHRNTSDEGGRTLPHWTGCKRLDEDDLLLLGDAPDSFDGRYWGPISVDKIEGVWRPLH